VDQEIRAGQTRTYDLVAKAGQFVSVSLDQKGSTEGKGGVYSLDLAIAGPDGKQAALSEIPNGNLGPQAFAILAIQSGVYRVTITSDAKSTPTRYRFQSVIVRDPSEDDRARVAAELSYTKARSLQTQLSADSRRAAIAEYEKARPYFESAGDQYRVGMILNATGLVYARIGEMRAAIPYFRRGEQIFHELRDAGREADSINNAAGMLDVLGDLEEARRMYEKALEMSRATGDPKGEAGRLANIGKILNDQAKFQDAIAYYRQALQLAQNSGDTRRVAIIFGNLGSVYLALADLESARDYTSRAIGLEQDSKDANTAQHFSDLGRIYGLLNQLSQGVPYYEKALELFRALGDKRGEGAALQSYGTALAASGDPSKARDILAQAASICHAVGDRRSEGLALTTLSSVALRLNQLDESENSARTALDALRSVGDSNGEARAYMALARSSRLQRRLLDARDFALQALAKDEQARQTAGADQVRASYFASRQDDYQFTIDLLMALDAQSPAQGFAGEALSTSERARARSLVDLLSESQAQISVGIDPALLARHLAIADALNSKGARLFALSSTSAQAQTLRQEIRDLEREDQENQAAIRKASPRYAELTNPSLLTSREIQQELLDPNSVLLEYSWGEERSFLWAVSKDAIQAYILPDSHVLEEQVAKVYTLLIARSSTPRLETPPETRRRIAQADRDLAVAAKELSENIVNPARSMLSGKRLVIVPDGALQRLPFSMLRDPASQDPLILAHEIVVLPSASALHELRTQLSGRKPAPKNLAVFADPIFDSSDPRAGSVRNLVASASPASRVLEHTDESSSAVALAVGPKLARLPFTGQEADQILRVARDSSNLKATGFQASRALATSGVLSQYRYVHFATHGYLDTERPSLSALVLSQLDEHKNAQDGFLRVNDIYNTRLSAELVVLSACQTGLGKEVRGEGLMGLTRAFLYAGAPRLIVSLWNVNDQATADLMANLYRGILRQGKTPSAALRDAQLEMRKQKNTESPYYWAAFVQQGEWR